ncbi:SMR family transporter [Alcaligenes pakistanensis]|uniref:SMR family transporter n=1 Tax=Alcaligenes pakistanensis TaxID=1482717 RepID=UPI0016771CB0|nr:SMR family transporter [Alcaligenes pakistanensis]
MIVIATIVISKDRHDTGKRSRVLYGDQHQVLALSLRSLPVGMAYAIWTGIDTFGLRLLDIICAC